MKKWIRKAVGWIAFAALLLTPFSGLAAIPEQPIENVNLIAGAPVIPAGAIFGGNPIYTYNDANDTLTVSSKPDTMYYVDYPLDPMLSATSSYVISVDFTVPAAARHDTYSGPAILFRKNANGNLLGFWMQSNATYIAEFILETDGQLTLNSVLGNIDNCMPDGSSGTIKILSTPTNVQISAFDVNGNILDLSYDNGVIGTENEWPIAGGAPAFGLASAKCQVTFANPLVYDTVVDDNRISRSPAIPTGAIFNQSPIYAYNIAAKSLTVTSKPDAMYYVDYALEASLIATSNYEISVGYSLPAAARLDTYSGPAFIFRKNTNGNLLGFWMQRNATYLAEFVLETDGKLTLNEVLGSIDACMPDGTSGTINILSTPSRVEFSVFDQNGDAVNLTSASALIGTKHGWNIAGGEAIFGVATKGAQVTFANAVVHDAVADNLVTGAPQIPNTVASHYRYHGASATLSALSNPLTMHMIEYPLSSRLQAKDAYTVSIDYRDLAYYDNYSGPIVVYRQTTDGKLLGIWAQKSALYHGVFRLENDGQLALVAANGLNNPLIAGGEGTIVIKNSIYGATLMFLDENGEAVPITYGDNHRLGLTYSFEYTYDGVEYVGSDPIVGVTMLRTVGSLSNVCVTSDSAKADTITIAATANGTLSLDSAVDPNNVSAGSIVNVTVTPAAGYQLKVGGLTYTVNGKTSPITTRIGAVDGASNVFAFKMPEGNVILNATFIDADADNIATLGFSFKGKDMRFVSRVYRRSGRGTLQACGSYLLRADSVLGEQLENNVALTPEQVGALQAAVEAGTAFKIPTTTLLDRCTEYVDFAVRINGAGENTYKYSGYICVAYATFRDGQTVYGNACVRSYTADVQHAVIMYPSGSRNVESTKPYVARMKDHMPTGEYLFDTFIYLRLLNTSGVFDDSAAANKADWQSCLDRYFKEGTDIPALEQSLEELQYTIGTPSSKRKVVISIPYPHRNTTNFGDVDGDGVDENFQNDNDRRKVLNWYIQQAIDRFNSYNFKHIELWGFYWDTESIPSDEIAVSMASDLVHDAGYKFMWIPYYQAPGYQLANQYFDITIMQPNYAFNDSTVDGKVGPERLEDAWELCRRNGFGIEMEIDTNSPADVAVFQRYLSYGSVYRLGYQFEVNGYFLGGLFVEEKYFSHDPRDVAIYEMLCDYVTGKPVANPDVYYLTSWDSSPLELDAGTDDRISNILISANHAVLGDWSGVIAAEFYRDGAWHEAGWLAVEADPTALFIRTLTIPTEGTAERVRLTVKQGTAFPNDAIRTVSFDHTRDRNQVNYCQGLSYTLTPDTANRPYDDNGTVLVNGNVNEWGLGWWSRAARIVIDLGSVQEVDGLELYVKNDNAAGIALPTLAYATFSEGKSSNMVVSGTGSVPTNFRMETGATTPVNSSTYCINFSTQRQRTRYVSLYVESAYATWIMLSEARVKCGSTVLPIASYALKTKTHAYGNKTDTGMKLTNGSIEYAYGNGCVSWDTQTDPGAKELIVDLEQSRAISEITLYSVSAPTSGVYSVKNAVFYTSTDGVHWTEQGTVDKSSLPQGGEIMYPVSLDCELTKVTRARYLKVVITPDKGTCAISEITAS